MGSKVINFSGGNNIVVCPKCGNGKDFSIVLDYLRISIERKGENYIGTWDEGKLSSAYCNRCCEELEFDDAETIYQNFFLKGDRIPEED